MIFWFIPQTQVDVALRLIEGLGPSAAGAAVEPTGMYLRRAQELKLTVRAQRNAKQDN